jgi:hypothetical protein
MILALHKDHDENVPRLAELVPRKNWEILCGARTLLGYPQPKAAEVASS